MERYELPEGWEWKRLSDPEVCILNPKRSELKNLSDSTSVTFVPMAAVDEISGIIAKPEVRRLDEVRKGYTYFAEGDVIFAKITPCMENGKSAIARKLTNGVGFGSTEFHVLRPLTRMIPEWLHMLVRSKIVRDEAKNSMYGAAGQQRVPIEFFKELEIPIPPLSEQRRIVKRIEELTRRVEESSKLRTANLKNISRLPPSAMETCFQGDDGWLSVPFEKAVKRVKSRGEKLKTEDYKPSGAIPIVDQGQSEMVGYTDRGNALFQGPIPVIIFGDHTKNIKYIDFDFAVGADGVVILQPIDDIIPEYFYYWLKSIPLHSLGYSRHYKLLKEQIVYFPEDKAKQRSIVEYLNSLQSKADELKQLQSETERELSAFTPALLAKAFRGEL